MTYRLIFEGMLWGWLSTAVQALTHTHPQRQATSPSEPCEHPSKIEGTADTRTHHMLTRCPLCTWLPVGRGLQSPCQTVQHHLHGPHTQPLIVWGQEGASPACEMPPRNSDLSDARGALQPPTRPHTLPFANL